MNINDQFPSKWLKASDLQGDTVVTMSHITTETVGDNQLPVLYFQGAQKGLVLNKTNANSISQIYGPETDGWVGRQMVMVSAFTDFQGQRTSCIRLNPPQPVTAPAVPAPNTMSTAQGQQTPANGPSQPIGQPVGQQHDERNPPPVGQPAGQPAAQTPLGAAIDDEIPF